MGDKVVFGYATNWSMYGRKFEAYQLPMDKLTHMVYAFFNVDEHSCEIVSVDENADFQRAINPASNTCIKGQSSWGTPSAGTIKAYEEMRKGAPHIKMLLSVGGWSMSNSFSKCTTDAASRAKIVGSVKKFLQEHDFDGIDYDWEFPGYNRTDGAGIPKFASKWTYDPEHDRDNFMALLAETRTMLGDLQKEKSRSDKYLQTIAIGMGPDKVEYLAKFFGDEKTMGNSLDYVNMMCYDFHGGWGNLPIGHNAPLHPPTTNPKENKGMSIEESVTRVIELVGAHKNKLVMGLPTYGRSIQVPKGTDIEKALDTAQTLDCKASDSVKTWETGSVSFWHQEWLATQPGWETKYDAVADQHYLWNESESIFMSYDNVDSIKKKVQWLNSMTSVVPCSGRWTTIRYCTPRLLATTVPNLRARVKSCLTPSWTRSRHAKSRPVQDFWPICSSRSLVFVWSNDTYSFILNLTYRTQSSY